MDEKDREKIYSKRVRAGKRTYFFDVKSTRTNDYYLTITESRRHPQGEGFVYEKHKMFLYKEDFDKFVEALQETVDHVKTELMPEVDFSQFVQRERDEQDDFASELKWE
ncbi:hypothetical protein GCM10028818_14740 [Spirosoma horti]